MLTIFYFHIDKHLPAVIYIPLILLIPVLFIAIIVGLIRQLIEIYRNRKYLKLSGIIPFLIFVLTFVYTCFSPFRLDSESLESKVVLKACYEGTNAQTTFRFRNDKTFEFHSTGVFFFSDWSLGNYSQKGDTLFLKFKGKKNHRIGDTILNNGAELITLDKTQDSLIKRLHIYVGDCRGLN